MTPSEFHIDDYGTAIDDEQGSGDMFVLFPFHVRLQQDSLGELDPAAQGADHVAAESL